MTNDAGFFVEGTSPIHRLHPLAKLAAAGALALIGLMIPGHWPWIVPALLLAVGLSAGTAGSQLKGLIVFGLPLALAVVLIVAVAPMEGATSFDLGFVSWNGAKTTEASNTVGQLIGVVMSFHLFSLTTDPEDLYSALLAAGLPRGPVSALTGSFVFIPNLQERMNCVREAQIARGVPVTGSRLQRFKSLPSMVQPLILSALSEAADREQALLLRGFELPVQASSVRETHWRRIDRWVVIATVAVLIATAVVVFR